MQSMMILDLILGQSRYLHGETHLGFPKPTMVKDFSFQYGLVRLTDLVAVEGMVMTGLGRRLRSV